MIKTILHIRILCQAGYLNSQWDPNRIQHGELLELRVKTEELKVRFTPDYLYVVLTNS